MLMRHIFPPYFDAAALMLDYFIATSPRCDADTFILRQTLLLSAMSASEARHAASTAYA